MFVTLSFRKFGDLIRQLEDLPNETDAELAVKLDHYSQRLWDHLRGYGIDCRGMTEHTPDVAAFQCDISKAAAWDGTGVDWDRLLGGLHLLNPVAITVEEDDMRTICSGLVAQAMLDNWPSYAHELQRITVSQLQSKIESCCLRFAWGNGMETTALSPNDKVLLALTSEEEIQLQFTRAGVTDPLAKRKAAQEAQRQQEAAYAEAEQARLERIIDGEF
jgi:hypothetical protein